MSEEHAHTFSLSRLSLDPFNPSTPSNMASTEEAAGDPTQPRSPSLPDMDGVQLGVGFNSHWEVFKTRLTGISESTLLLYREIVLMGYMWAELDNQEKKDGK